MTVGGSKISNALLEKLMLAMLFPHIFVKCVRPKAKIRDRTVLTHIASRCLE